MSRILIDPAGVSAIRSTIEEQTQRIQAAEQQVNQIASSLDMQVASSENIRQTLNALQKSCKANETKLEGMVKLLDRVNSEFVRVDRNITNQAKALEYRMGHIGKADFLGTATLPVAATAVGAISALFGITDEGYSTIEVALQQIRKFLHGQTVRTDMLSDEGTAIYKYLQEEDADTLFGRYSFSAKFVSSDLSAAEVIAYGAKNWKQTLKSMVFGGFSGDEMAEVFLDDPDKCKSFLRGVIDDICQTEYADIMTGDQEKALGYIKDLAEFAGYDDSAAMIDELTGMIGNVETADKILKDYSANVAMLESLKDLAPGNTMLSETIDELIFDYNHQAVAVLFDDLKEHVESGITDVAEYALGLKIGVADTIIQTALSDVPALDTMDTVLYTSGMRATAIGAFREAAEKIQSGSFTDADLTAYKNSFSLAQTMTLREYEAMLPHYSQGSKEALYLQDQIEQLKTMSYNNFNYATAYSDFKLFSSGAGTGGGGGGGRAF